MNPILETLTGTAALTDEIIASDLLISSKTGVWNYANAIAETTSPDVLAVLRKHLQEAIRAHQQVTAYMVDQGWYHPYNPPEQIQLDVRNAEIALNLP